MVLKGHVLLIAAYPKIGFGDARYLNFIVERHFCVRDARYLNFIVEFASSNVTTSDLIIGSVSKVCICFRSVFSSS